jgi:hypothetical protein
LLSQVINNPENQQLRSVNGENRQLVERLLCIGHCGSDGDGNYVSLGLHCLLSIGFSIAEHGAVPSLQRQLQRLKHVAVKSGAAVDSQYGTGVETVFAVATAASAVGSCLDADGSDSRGKYRWGDIIDQYYGVEGGVQAVMRQYIDHGWRLGEEAVGAGSSAPSALLLKESVGVGSGSGSSASFPLHSFQFTFLPEPNPESGAEEDLERWSLWYNSLSSYSECFP